MNRADAAQVLVVVDHPLERHIFERLLLDDGFRVYLADSEIDAIRSARIQRPDVVVFDLVFEGEAWARIRDACGNVPLVVAGHFTGQAGAQHMSASAFLPKKKYVLVVDAVRAALKMRSDSGGDRPPYVPPVDDQELLRTAIHDARQRIRTMRRRSAGID